MNTRSLHIIGAGDLARRVARLLLNEALIEGLDESTIRYETRRLKPESHGPSDFLLIAFPPGEDYAGDVARALQNWNKRGQALLVSSIGVHSESEGAWIDEESPVLPQSPLVDAEKIATTEGAHVLRLAGLYDEARGPHIFWQKSAESNSWPDGFVNLVHRDDAAEVCARLLASSIPAATWLVSDACPLSRVQIARAWAEARNLRPTHFSASSGSLGKRVSAKKIREALPWEPRWKSFLEFCESLRLGAV